MNVHSTDDIRSRAAIVWHTIDSLTGVVTDIGLVCMATSILITSIYARELTLWFSIANLVLLIWRTILNRFAPKFSYGLWAPNWDDVPTLKEIAIAGRIWRFLWSFVTYTTKPR